MTGSLTGKTFSHYEILAPLGAGGMGEVYRARDTKLEREVAIKVLPDELAADPDRLARFEREAKLLAALNHTNIGAIYGLEEADNVRFLVLNSRRIGIVGRCPHGFGSATRDQKRHQNRPRIPRHPCPPLPVSSPAGRAAPGGTPQDNRSGGLR